jgi:hypothetical protein
MTCRLIILFVVTTLFSCEERFDPILERLDSENYIINGYINQSVTDSYVVTVQQTNTSGPPTPVFNAQVEVIDEHGLRERFIEGEIGTYESKGEIVQGKPGTAYYLEVKITNGQFFRSIPDLMPNIIIEDTMTWREEIFVSTSTSGTDVGLPYVVVDLQAMTPSSSSSYNIWWVLEETFQFNEVDFPDPFGSIPPPCYITQIYGPGTIDLFTKTGYSGEQFDQTELFIRDIDESFLAKHLFTTFQHSVSDEYYKYLKDLASLVENSGSLFDTPPGRAVGNFLPVEGTDLVPLGYFSAVLTDTSRIAVYPSQLSFTIPNKCAFIDAKAPSEYDAQCRNCEVIPRSTKLRPKFWNEL